METDEDEDRLTLGTSEVVASLQLTTPQSDEDGGRLGQRQAHSREEQSGSFFTADDTPE